MWTTPKIDSWNERTFRRVFLCSMTRQKTLFNFFIFDFAKRRKIWRFNELEKDVLLLRESKSSFTEKEKSFLNKIWSSTWKWIRDVLERHLGEKIGNRFAVVSSSNRLGKHHRNIDHLDLVAVLHFFFLWDRVCHHDGLERRVVDSCHGRTAEDSVRTNGVDFARASAQ